MKKLIKNLSAIDPVLKFELDQIQLQLGQLQSEMDQISTGLKKHQTQQQEQRAGREVILETGIPFNSEEQSALESSHQERVSIEKIGRQIEELQGVLREKFQDSKKINKIISGAQTNFKAVLSKEEQKVIDQLGELQAHLNKLKEL